MNTDYNSKSFSDLKTYKQYGDTETNPQPSKGQEHMLKLRYEQVVSQFRGESMMLEEAKLRIEERQKTLDEMQRQVMQMKTDLNVIRDAKSSRIISTVMGFCDTGIGFATTVPVALLLGIPALLNSQRSKNAIERCWDSSFREAGQYFSCVFASKEKLSELEQSKIVDCHTYLNILRSMENQEKNCQALLERYNLLKIEGMEISDKIDQLSSHIFVKPDHEKLISHLRVASAINLETEKNMQNILTGLLK